MDTRIKFIEKTCERKGRETRSDVSESATAFVSIPYVKAVSEGIQRTWANRMLRPHSDHESKHLVMCLKSERPPAQASS